MKLRHSPKGTTRDMKFNKTFHIRLDEDSLGKLEHIRRIFASDNKSGVPSRAFIIRYLISEKFDQILFRERR